MYSFRPSYPREMILFTSQSFFSLFRYFERQNADSRLTSTHKQNSLSAAGGQGTTTENGRRCCGGCVSVLGQVGEIGRTLARNRKWLSFDDPSRACHGEHRRRSRWRIYVHSRCRTACELGHNELYGVNAWVTKRAQE